MSAPQRNRVGSLPKGASFGRAGPRSPGVLLNYAEVAENGSRAQRRWALRLMRRAGQTGGTS